MKILALTKKEKVERYTEDKNNLAHFEIVYSDGENDAAILDAGSDADIIIADAVQEVSAYVIGIMPNLKLIHSEGVAFNKFDIDSASKRGIYVCNCKGMNASAVAEQAILLMLGLIKSVTAGDRSVRAGTQINTKMGYMVSGSLGELGECTVGLIGFGDIAKATASLLNAFGCRVIYNAAHRHPETEERKFNVQYMERDELLHVSDIVSLHVPAGKSTYHMADDDFFSKMKDGAYLINTSRGELVDNDALIKALKSDRLAGAGLDTIETEPVSADNILLNSGREVTDKLLLSCHIAGITGRSFLRGYNMIWDNIRKLEAGKRPDNIVNGI